MELPCVGVGVREAPSPQPKVFVDGRPKSVSTISEVSRSFQAFKFCYFLQKFVKMFHWRLGDGVSEAKFLYILVT